MISVFAKLPNENNTEYAYRSIKEAILSFKLVPGKLINVIELTKVLGISGTPVKQAMVKLKNDHLVEIVPQVGTYVSKINNDLIKEAIFMRYVLEKEVLKLVCKSFPEKEMQALKMNVKKQEWLLNNKGEALEFHKLDNEFHQIIFQGNRKANLWDSITKLNTHYSRVILLSEMEGSWNNTIKQHKTIVSIIENKKVDQVKKVLRQHIIEPTRLWGDLLGQPIRRLFRYFL